MPDPDGAIDPVPEITIAALENETMALWRTVASVARSLEDQQMRWCLVGGLMVALFAIEAGQRSRPTKDIDILGDARQRPSATERLANHLLDLGATHHEISGFDREKGFRFELDGQVIDVLAPDGLGKPAKTSRQFRTIQIPGGSQALSRIERVALVVDGRRSEIFRPTLLGALLLKARALPASSHPDDQREDLVQLLSLVTDPRALASTMAATERRWLRTVEDKLDLGNRDLDTRFEPAPLMVARAAYPRLIA
jgi:hypothetical protein